MKQDERWPHQPKNHVQTEPGSYRSNALQCAHAFAERIEQQQQHQARSGNSEPVTKPVVGDEIVLVAVEPADHESGRESGAKRRAPLSGGPEASGRKATLVARLIDLDDLDDSWASPVPRMPAAAGSVVPTHPNAAGARRDNGRVV